MPDEQQEQEQKPEPGPSADDIEKMKAALKKANDEAAKFRHEVKAKDDELTALRESQDSSKSEMDKVRDQLAALTERASKAEREALVAKVAQAKKLPAALAGRLSGATEEELTADADSLVEALGLDTSETDDGEKPGHNRRPQERLRPGASNDDDQEVDGDKIAEQVLARKRF